MASLGEYLMSVAAAAIICSLVQRLLNGKGAAAQIGKMLCAIFLLFTVLQPVCQLSLPDPSGFLEDYQLEASEAASQGEQMAKQQLKTIISQRVSAYILDKAASYDANIQVEVKLSDASIPTPEAIAISGNISPYGKRQLETIIEQYLGISGENLIWK